MQSVERRNEKKFALKWVSPLGIEMLRIRGGCHKFLIYRRHTIFSLTKPAFFYKLINNFNELITSPKLLFISY
ncbi:MAG TPA: hypothetical protein DCP92_20300 [Nitrospiraceae bacterium]|nr:hypothetical protein [Nitrospiraceae bacterium]